MPQVASLQGEKAGTQVLGKRRFSSQGVGVYATVGRILTVDVVSESPVVLGGVLRWSRLDRGVPV